MRLGYLNLRGSFTFVLMFHLGRLDFQTHTFAVPFNDSHLTATLDLQVAKLQISGVGAETAISELVFFTALMASRFNIFFTLNHTCVVCNYIADSTQCKSILFM